MKSWEEQSRYCFLFDGGLDWSFSPFGRLFSTTRIKPLWIVGRLYCDFLEMCLVLWWRPLYKHHWYDLPFWQTTCLTYAILCMFKGLSLQNDSLVTIDCVHNPVLSCSARLRISRRDFLMAPSLHVGWEANHHGGFFRKSQSTSEQRTPASPFASPFFHRLGLMPEVYFGFYAYASPHTVHFVTRIMCTSCTCTAWFL